MVIIDQPEDDLDNQTIYDDVIKIIRAMKPRTQFIFATHNANIPVLEMQKMSVPVNIQTERSRLSAEAWMPLLYNSTLFR